VPGSMTLRPPASRRMDEDDEAAILADMREGLAARGELADDYTDDELRYSLRVTLLALAIEYGGESAPPEH
jgi:hypothetical protein